MSYLCSVVLLIPGVGKENIFSAIKDVAYLNNMLGKVTKAKDIVVIGGGFIGVEFADEYKKNRGNSVTIIEMLSCCLRLALDEEFCIETRGFW